MESQFKTRNEWLEHIREIISENSDESDCYFMAVYEFDNRLYFNPVRLCYDHDNNLVASNVEINMCKKKVFENYRTLNEYAALYPLNIGDRMWAFEAWYSPFSTDNLVSLKPISKLEAVVYKLQLHIDLTSSQIQGFTKDKGENPNADFSVKN